MTTNQLNKPGSIQRPIKQQRQTKQLNSFINSIQKIMRKPRFYAALGLLALAGCTTNDEFFSPEQELAQGRQATTRAGYEGSINTTTLQTASSNTTQTASDGANGFGVFAYYTGTTSYAQNSKPEFMYNQQVYYQTDWKYTPIKYWPNEGVDNSTNKGVDDQDGDQNNQNATTAYENGGYVSFFAYAPYVFLDNFDGKSGDIEAATPSNVATPKSGTANYNDGVTSGIIAVSGNAVQGDPKVRYKLANDGQVVDLLWGTAGTNGGKATDGVPFGSQIGVTGTHSGSGTTYQEAIYNDKDPDGNDRDYTLNADLQKMNVEGKVDFNFKHALAKVGGSTNTNTTVDGSDDDPTTPTNGFLVVLDVDKNPYETGGVLETMTETMTDGSTPMNNGTTCKYKTKVTIESIEITSNKQVNESGKSHMSEVLTNVASYQEGLIGEGIFNLATGRWKTTYDNSGTETHYSDASIDHLITTDGSVANSDAVLNSNIKEVVYTSGGRDDYFKNTLPIGVTTVPKNVYGNEANPLVFIPGTRPVITVSVVYYVRTYDKNLEKKYSEVKQKITKSLAFGEDVGLNKQYNLVMHLGITSVKFTATVANWDKPSNITGTDGGTPDDPSDDVIVYESDVEHVYLPINVGKHKMQKFEVTYDGTTSTQTAGEKRTDVAFSGGTALSKSDIAGNGGSAGTITSVVTTLRDQANDGDKEYSRQWTENTYSTSWTSTSGNTKYTGSYGDLVTVTAGVISLAPNYTTAARNITVNVTYNKTDETYNFTSTDITITQKGSSAPVINASDESVAHDVTSVTISPSLQFNDGSSTYGFALTQGSSQGQYVITVKDAGTLGATIAGNVISFSANASTTDTKSATFTITYTDYEGDTLTKDITVTQGANS